MTDRIAVAGFFELIALILPQMWQNHGLNHPVICLEMFDRFDQSLL
jgi:hypothetical protein